VSVKVLYQGKFQRFVREEGWEFLERLHEGGIVAVLAVTADQKIVLVEQFRIPVRKNVIELPAGVSNDVPEHSNETLVQAAHRELLEETGYQAEGMIPVLTGPVAAASSRELMTFFKTTRVRKVAAGGGDEQEKITVHEIPLDGIRGWLAKKREEGFYVDPKIYIGLFLLMDGK